MKPFDLKAAAEMALEALEDTLALCINYKSVEDADGYVFTEASDVIKQGESAHKALRQALDQLPDTTKMIDTGTDRGAWSDVPDATKWVDELRGDDEEPPFTDQGVKFTCGDCPQGGCCEVVEPPNSTTDFVEREGCIVGIKGSAYDPIDTKRAYTYANQPGNVVAYKLGRASSSASLQRAGDFIDSGLILLKELQVEGYGVFDIGAEYIAQSNSTTDVVEPVAWIVPDYGFLFPNEDSAQRYLDNTESGAKPTPLYTAPPQREWVGLTNEEIIEIDNSIDSRSYSLFTYTRAIEAKIREKNHG